MIGETVVDIIKDSQNTRVYPGGSPANVAYGLGKLERNVALLTQLGRDTNGELAREHLAAAGVTILPTAPTARTATSTAVLDSHGAATYEFDIDWTLPSNVEHHLAPSHVHTGSIAALTPPGADKVEALVRSMHSTATVSFDPNIRPALLDSRADAIRRTKRFISLADVVKASDEDIAWLYPEVSHDAVIDEWLDSGPGIVVITKGARGAAVATHDHRLDVPTPRTPVVDTVGAGDSFMAALLDSMLRVALLGVQHRSTLGSTGFQRLLQSAQRASTAASITVSRPGANPPNVDELDAALVNSEAPAV
ncbi:carbohydrate kinase [Georgenia daeguensis]|uniref:Carbohydrate kinase n=1 Tax=Georgenia daeguensis TaxID=908355 RepID=A0ABP6UPL8_9MICO